MVDTNLGESKFGWQKALHQFPEKPSGTPFY